MTFEEGLEILKNTFTDYINVEVLSKVEVDELGKRNIIYKSITIYLPRNILYRTSNTKISRF